MTDRVPVETTNLDRYGFPALPWSRPVAAITEQIATPDITWFLGTIRPDGTPHAASSAGYRSGSLGAARPTGRRGEVTQGTVV